MSEIETSNLVNGRGSANTAAPAPHQFGGQLRPPQIKIHHPQLATSPSYNNNHRPAAV